MTTSRITPGRLRDVGLLAWTIAHAGGRRTGSDPINLFLVLGRHRRLFRSWLFFAGRLMPRGRLPRTDTELVILRVAHLTGCEYEWRHHTHIARSAGLTDADLARVTRDDEEWPARHAAVIAATDQLIGTGDLDDATWTRLREHFDDRRCIELVMLATHYQMLATTIRALRIPLERTSDQAGGLTRRVR